MLSRRHGKVRAVAKGVRRTSSKFGARLEPFMVADVQLYQGRSLDIVQQAESLGSYGTDIAAHYDRFTAANAMVETADRLSDAEATPISTCSSWAGCGALSRGEHVARSILDSYLLRVMSLSGWAPSLDECARCGTPGPHARFVAQLGGLVCTNCAPAGSPRVAEKTLALLRALISGGVGRHRCVPARRHRGRVRTRLRLRPVAPGARHPLARPCVGHLVGRTTMSRSPTRTKTRCPIVRWTGPECTRRRSGPCPSTSRSSWTATAAGPTAEGSTASKATRRARRCSSTSSPAPSRPG